MHSEALTAKGRELFPLLPKFTDFYLAGGTALALQIGHRISIDFDESVPVGYFEIVRLQRVLEEALGKKN